MSWRFFRSLLTLLYTRNMAPNKMAATIDKALIVPLNTSVSLQFFFGDVEDLDLVACFCSVTVIGDSSNVSETIKA